jgi:hypothetical protein
MFTCQCGKEFKANSGFGRHKLTCSKFKKASLSNRTSSLSPIKSSSESESNTSSVSYESYESDSSSYNPKKNLSKTDYIKYLEKRVFILKTHLNYTKTLLKEKDFFIKETTQRVTKLEDTQSLLLNSLLKKKKINHP